MAVYQVTYKIGDEELITNRDHPNVKNIRKYYDEQSSYFRVYYNDGDVVDIYYPIEVVWKVEVKIDTYHYKVSKTIEVYIKIFGLDRDMDEPIRKEIFESIEEYNKFISDIKNEFKNCIIRMETINSEMDEPYKNSRC